MAEQGFGKTRPPLPRPPQLRGITRAKGLNGVPSPGTITGKPERTDTVSDPQIVCPNCRTEIKLTESLAAPLIAETRRKFDQQLAAKEEDFGRRETLLKQAREEIAKAREAVDEQVAAKLKAQRSSIAEAEAKRARLAVADELSSRDQQLADLRQMLTTNGEKLAAAQKIQADMLRKERELDDARREVELTVETKVQQALAAVRDKAKLDAEDSFKAKVAEKEAQIAGMNRQIEELRRRAEQGSQQLQGEPWSSNWNCCSVTIFRATSLSRCRKATLGATSCTACPALVARRAGRSYGNQSEPNAGATTG